MIKLIFGGLFAMAPSYSPSTAKPLALTRSNAEHLLDAYRACGSLIQVSAKAFEKISAHRDVLGKT